MSRISRCPIATSTTRPASRADIEVDKTLRRGDLGDFVQGPIEVHVGDAIQYRFEVTNEGDTELVVEFSDTALRCRLADGSDG